MLPGDFIVALDGKAVKDRNQLVLLVGDLRAGQKAVFSIVRNGSAKDIEVRIEERKDDVAAENAKLWPGIILMPISDELRTAAKLADGAKGRGGHREERRVPHGRAIGRPRRGRERQGRE